MSLDPVLGSLGHQMPQLDAHRAGAEFYGAPRLSLFELFGPNELALSRVLGDLFDPRGSPAAKLERAADGAEPDRSTVAMSPPPCLDNRKRKFTVLRSAATVATLIAGLCCWPAPSEAYIEHPWCTRSGSTSCGFDSYEQCMENARLLTQTNCVANPWIHPLPQAPPHAHARGAAARGR